MRRKKATKILHNEQSTHAGKCKSWDKEKGEEYPSGAAEN